MNPSNLSRDQLIAELLGQVPHELVEPGHGQLELPLRAREQHGALHAECLLRHRLDVARELLLRDLCARLASGPVMASPKDLRDWLRLNCGALSHEVFIVLFLDAQHRLIAAEQMFRGTLTQTSVYPREVVKEALARHAAAVVLAHNHPSGLPEPSRADEHLTQMLKSALATCDVRVLDHLIVGGDRIVSMAEMGLI